MSTQSPLTATIPENLGGERVDRVLAQLFPDFSRARLQQWIRQGEITVDGRILRPRDKVAGGETVVVTPSYPDQGDWQGEAIPLDIVFEDEVLIVINKAAGMVVHPAAGNYQGTLLNALLHHAPELAQLPRAGIVHRLDKDTSGLLVIARTLPAHKSLVEQMQARTIKREYAAIVQGVMTAGGTVDAPIGRHPQQRKRMAVVPNGRPAITHYRVSERFRAHSAIRVMLETGRTHQIRVHMAHIHYPLVGDPVYGGRLRLPPACSSQLREQLQQFRRQALHAAQLTLQHPLSGDEITWQADMADDMVTLLAALKQDNELFSGS